MSIYLGTCHSYAYRADKKFFNELVGDMPELSTKHLSLINHLVRNGDYQSVKYILDKIPDIRLGETPDIHHSMSGADTIYYLDALLKTEGTSQCPSPQNRRHFSGDFLGD